MPPSPSLSLFQRLVFAADRFYYDQPGKLAWLDRGKEKYGSWDRAPRAVWAEYFTALVGILQDDVVERYFPRQNAHSSPSALWASAASHLHGLYTGHPHSSQVEALVQSWHPEAKANPLERDDAKYLGQFFTLEHAPTIADHMSNLFGVFGRNSTSSAHSVGAQLLVFPFRFLELTHSSFFSSPTLR
ncbi:hypothetical protein JCM11251_004055 [Rhodosporidiobolus azoricus]